MLLELDGGLVAEELHRVAAFDRALPFGREALQFDRADFGAVLFFLRALLRLLVGVELALDPTDGAVEEVDGRPEEVIEVRLEARLGKGGDKGVEDVGDRAGRRSGFGQRSGVRLVGEGTIAIELEFAEKVGGGR